MLASKLQIKQILKSIIFTCLMTLPDIAIAANDKKQIELTCGETRATITCTKLGKVEGNENVCLKSKVEFELKNGHHVISHDTPPQNFATPTIADRLSCESTKGNYYFTVWYSPDCDAAQCLTLYLFDDKGQIVAKSLKEFKKIRVVEPKFIGETANLRGGN